MGASLTTISGRVKFFSFGDKDFRFFDANYREAIGRVFAGVHLAKCSFNETRSYGKTRQNPGQGRGAGMGIIA